jgi:hypothetical protein
MTNTNKTAVTPLLGVHSDDVRRWTDEGVLPVWFVDSEGRNVYNAESMMATTTTDLEQGRDAVDEMLDRFDRLLARCGGDYGRRGRSVLRVVREVGAETSTAPELETERCAVILPFPAGGRRSDNTGAI